MLSPKTNTVWSPKILFRLFFVCATGFLFINGAPVLTPAQLSNEERKFKLRESKNYAGARLGCKFLDLRKKKP